MTKKKEVALKDCFTYEELISIHARLSMMADDILSSGMPNCVIDSRISGLQSLMKPVLAAAVCLREEPA